MWEIYIDTHTHTPVYDRSTFFAAAKGQEFSDEILIKLARVCLHWKKEPYGRDIMDLISNILQRTLSDSWEEKEEKAEKGE